MIKVWGLKCDACDYTDITIERSEYINYINYPCPECGAPLLTQADYDAIVFLESNPLSDSENNYKIVLDGGGLATMKMYEVKDEIK